MMSIILHSTQNAPALQPERHGVLSGDVFDMLFGVLSGLLMTQTCTPLSGL